ncbi:MAG: beta-propeller domain-containing protein [Nocardioides sp.]
MKASARSTAIGLTVCAAVGVSVGIGAAVVGSPQELTDRAMPKAVQQGSLTDPVISPAGSGGLSPVQSCDKLLSWYVAQGVKQVGPYGWHSPLLRADRLGAGAEVGAPAPIAAPGGDLQSSTSSATGTNVQEAGVDEPDAVKNNGTTLARIRDNTLTTYDLGRARPTLRGTLRLADIAGGEILLAGDQVIVLGFDQASTTNPGGTRMIRVDISDPASPRVVGTMAFSSTLVSATQHDTTVRLVLSQPLPDLDFAQPNPGQPNPGQPNPGRPGGWTAGSSGEEATLEINQRKVRDTTLADWLPTITGDSGSDEPLMRCTDVAIPDRNDGLGTLSVVGLDAAGSSGESQVWSATAVTTASRIAYASADRMYLATPTTGGDHWRNRPCCLADRQAPLPASVGSTNLHAFALGGIGARYLASGTVDGTVADRWSMDEANGVLRVAISQSTTTGTANSIVTLADDDHDLVEVGRLDGLGVNEDIYAMRWFDSMAIMVTYRQVDPLYAIDLSDTERPRLWGQLKIPGFSDYLHPIGARRLIGMGSAGDEDGLTGAAQAGLFDLSDATHPRRESVVTYEPETIALAGQDPRQFTWLPDQRTALTVVSRADSAYTGFVSVLTVTDGDLRNRMVRVAYGDDVSQIRLVPIVTGAAAGKVVLVSGDRISFFAF